MIIAAGTLLFAAPALAQSSKDIPEPSSMVLLGLGVLGLIVGRQVANKRPDGED